MIVRRVSAWLLVALVGIAGAKAVAQEVLEFKPVPAESAARIEERRPARRARSAVPPPPPAPGVPPAPAVPPAPPSPDPITIGKSGNIMRVGSDIHIESDQVVVGDVLALGGDITVDGHVEGDVVAMGGDVYVNASGRVDGDVVCMGGQLHEEEGAVIGGQRVTASRSGRDRGRRIVVDPDTHDSGSRKSVTGPFVWLLITLGFAWAFAGLAPGRTGRSLETLQREPGVSAVTGILAAMLTVPSIVALCLLVALLCITIIGIPLAIGALFGYFAFLGVLWVWGFVIGCAALGDVIVRRRAAVAPAPAVAATAGGTSWSVPGLESATASAPVAASQAQPAQASLTRAAVWGVLIVSGAGLLGSLFHLIGVGAIGTLLRVLSWLAFSALTLVGAGAWLRAEFKAGTLSRLWSGRRRATVSAPAAAAPEGGSAGISSPPGEPPTSPAGA